MSKNVIQLKLEGRFKFVAIRPDGTERLLADWGRNLILDSGLNRLGTDGAWDTCRVGSGSTAPATSQTALTTPVAASTTVVSNTGGVNSPTNTYAWARQVYRFAAGVAAGNLSEVGVGWSGGLFSRALILDEEGDPTTITVLSDEVLDVSYEIRAYPVMTDQTMVVNISGVDYTFTVRPCSFQGNLGTGGWPAMLNSLMSAGLTNAAAIGVGAYGADSTLAAVSAMSVNGTALVGPSTAPRSFRSAYSSGSYLRQCRIEYGLGEGSASFGGFTFLSYAGIYQAVVSPVIPKSGANSLRLDFSFSWARA